MLVSVIVPNYNYGHVLGQCLRAIQAQSYSPIEIVLVDDGSTDNSVEVAESLGVTPIRTPANRGCGAARNLGAANATGEILFFLDSDIALDPGAVAAAVELLQSEPNIGAVCGNYEPEPLNPGGLTKEYRNLFHHYYWRAAEGPTDILVPAITAMTRKVWDDVGPFSEHLMQTEAAVVAGRLIDRYEIRITSAVRGHHDDDPNLWVVLRKVFTRTRMQVPFFLQRRYAAGVIGSSESRVSASAALSLATVLLPLVTGVPALAAVPLLVLCGYLATDRRMYRYVFGLRGIGFGVFFTATHYLVNLTIAAGAAIGIAQWAVSPSFRRLYG
ncbi:glycosyltransferase family 2 protein [Actinocrispum sp. NPDC049592]|uniref:glycosyltransferase family 2 protein n=1 Tax=Actinocrispum sp. NPDC049592 TaxID=3154835 RepID=UPI003444D543